MRPKKGKGAKGFKVGESQKASSGDKMDLTNLSSIDKASFLEGLQLKDGNPLHSTAMEEDLEEGQMDKDGAGKNTVKPTSKQQRGAAVKRKKTEEDGETEKEKKRKNRNKLSTGETHKTRPEKGETEGEEPQSIPKSITKKSRQPDSKAKRPLVGKMSARKSSAGQKSAAKPVKKKRESEPAHVESDLQEDSDSGTAQQSHRRVLSSDEEGDEDTSWKPSPKKAKMYNLSRKSSFERSKSRKSSSGSTSGECQKPSSDKQKRKKHGRTEFEVVLDAFLDFCEQYRESVESQAVKQAIDSFSTNVKEQLLEKISSYKEFKTLKRENAKVGSMIYTKRQRLLNAKHELMRAERQVSTLQKEKAELELRLADLRQSQAFLHDIRELNRKYLDYRRKHPNEKQTYGASSLPALLLETKYIQVAEHQLRGNEQLDENKRKRTVK